MEINRKEKILLFGAGKIGRSFIGQLFSMGGYEVVFVDIVKDIIDELNKRRAYQVVIKADRSETLNIENVRGLHLGNNSLIVNEIKQTPLLAVSVGQKGLEGIIPLIAKGLWEKFLIDPTAQTDIIIAENMRNADVFMRTKLMENLPKEYPVNKLVGLVETSIGKMVPLISKEEMKHDILKVYAEPYNTLILDRKAFKNKIPEIPGLAPKENMKAWVDRKLFIHNLGHVSAAYLGYFENPKYKYLFEVLENSKIFADVRQIMMQAAAILQKMYPQEFNTEQLINHIDNLLYRFKNKALGDTVYRVGSDLMRKLSTHDRIMSPIWKGISLQLPVNLLISALAKAFFFKAVDEEGNLFPDDKKFHEQLALKGPEFILRRICGIEKEKNQHLYNLVITELKRTRRQEG